MSKLNDTQLVLLSNAAKRDDGGLTRSAKLKPEAMEQAFGHSIHVFKPAAKPRAGQSRIPNMFRTGLAIMAPVMPVRMTSRPSPGGVKATAKGRMAAPTMLARET